MARVIADYSFVNREGVMVAPEDIFLKRRREEFYLKGITADSWANLTGRKHYQTTSVTKIDLEKKKVTTRFGEYILGTILPEYKEFLEMEKKGIHAIGNWNLYGAQERGYYITADMFPQKKALGMAKIVAQEGNCIIVRRMMQNSEWGDEETVFVCWNSMSQKAKDTFRATGKLAKDVIQFAEFNGSHCKPMLTL